METILLRVKTQGIDYVNNFVFDNGLEGRLGFDFTDCGVDGYEKFAYIRLEDETLIKYSLGTGIRTNIPVRTEFTRSEIIQITPVAEKVVGGKRETHTFGLFTIDTQQVIGSITELDPANIDIIERLLKEFQDVLDEFDLVDLDVKDILERLNNFVASGKTAEEWITDFQLYVENKFGEYYDKDEINERFDDFEFEEYEPFKASVYTKDQVYNKDETDGLLDDKADKVDVYTKSETYTKDEVNAIAFDGELEDYYKKSETDGLLDDKADKNAVYNKSEIDGLLNDKVSETDFNQLSSEVSLLEVRMDDKADKNTVYTKTEVNSLIESVGTILDAYPVGAIYISVNNVNPSTFIGGTWEAFSKGRTIFGVDTTQTEFNTVEKTGGHKELQSHSHSFSGSTNSAGSHKHGIRRWNLNGTAGTDYVPNVEGNVNTGWDTNMSDTAGEHTHTVSGTIGSTGGGNSGNLPPYITVYMWKRIA